MRSWVLVRTSHCNLCVRSCSYDAPVPALHLTTTIAKQGFFLRSVIPSLGRVRPKAGFCFRGQKMFSTFRLLFLVAYWLLPRIPPPPGGATGVGQVWSNPPPTPGKMPVARPQPKTQVSAQLSLPCTHLRRSCSCVTSWWRSGSTRSIRKVCPMLRLPHGLVCQWHSGTKSGAGFRFGIWV